MTLKADWSENVKKQSKETTVGKLRLGGNPCDKQSMDK